MVEITIYFKLLNSVIQILYIFQSLQALHLVAFVYFPRLFWGYKTICGTSISFSKV